tara:strand:+ start:132 stop:1010 length:879 start_codon:yes stop_codon:yes gene_type:complete
MINKTYALYHIPGKKVGVTNNIEERVVKQQGYQEGEFEILAWSDDIGYISKLEHDMQDSFGYKVDEQLYKDLYSNNFKQFKKMKINVTEATTTFPCPINKLKGQLMDEIGMQWQTEHGEFTITPQTVNWIMTNVRSSQFSSERSYIYNKAFSLFYDKDPHRNIIVGKTHDADLDQQHIVDYYKSKDLSTNCSDCNENIFECIREWADERGLYEKGDPKTQYIKLMEEAGEVGRALLKDDIDEVVDGIGDMVVVLTNLAELCGVSIEECIQEAYDVISKRKGKMVNGTFVKDN